jgi:3-phosphoshikimate 1-carboxyvinyltransferase
MERDQGFILEFLSANGINIKSDSGKPPFQLEGQLTKRALEVDGSMSSQFLSGLLIGLPLSGNTETALFVKDLKSIPYVNMTLDTLRKYGVQLKHDDHKKFLVPGNQTYQVTDYLTESDWSAASYWLVAAALGHKIEVNGLNPNSYQADRALITALLESGCNINLDDRSVTVDGSNRGPLDFDATHCPDLFPALAIYAAFTGGVSRVKGVSRLANKESDRATVIKSELQKMGVLVELKEDYMLIHGGGSMHSASIDSHNDHRIAMAFAIAGTMIKDGLLIQGAEAVNKSYPEFWDHLWALS